ncbi:iron-containing alcohol dehydrogenase [Natranaerofaba carboxydovora]|uniref:iron-containing alcohol dehydrogenase n=1 Tax=Natranaerofaba carboxydovora TaxID=2742683 RepID=UPI001F13BB78|nr:iron-containing alcohol dehydrogenase [Natranaerofaba carboxydovora]UMZ74191.1 1,3-propanediol dehydrogenase [Natranaerofaba carboxydovora]
MDIFKFVIPEIIFGAGSHIEIGKSADRLGANKVFVVSDEGVKNTGWVDESIKYIKEADLSYSVWTEITPNPKDYEIVNGAEEYLNNRCDAIIAVGGGSVIDAAKAIAILVANGGSIEDYEGIDKITKPLPPLVVVPTTAGSGAEITQFCIITNKEKKSKMSIVSKSLIPDISISDPNMLATKPFELTANTGMDALTHAIEAYTSIAATPFTDVNALNAIKLISSNLRQSTAQKDNMKAKEAMAMASIQAAKAFSNAILGAVHAMTHQLGGFLDVPHGAVNAILLPYVMRFNLISCVEKYADIARAFGEADENLSSRELAEKAISAVDKLARDIDIPRNLREFGVKEEHIPLLSQNALKDVCLVTNPRDASKEDIEKVFKTAI